MLKKKRNLESQYYPYYLETEHGVYFFPCLNRIRVNDNEVLLLDESGKEIFFSSNVEFKIKKVGN